MVEWHDLGPMLIASNPNGLERARRKLHIAWYCGYREVALEKRARLDWNCALEGCSVALS